MKIKIWKRLIVALLVAQLVVTLAPAGAFAQEQVAGAQEIVLNEEPQAELQTEATDAEPEQVGEEEQNTRSEKAAPVQPEEESAGSAGEAGGEAQQTEEAPVTEPEPEVASEPESVSEPEAQPEEPAAEPEQSAEEEEQSGQTETAAPEQTEEESTDPEPESVSEEQQTEAASETSEETGTKTEKETKVKPDAESETMPAFEESLTVDGIKITVKAPEGVFPEDAVLSVEKVPVPDQEEADAAVEQVREEDRNVAVSYTFDIKVLSKDGEELTVEEDQKVEVTFAAAEVADQNLEPAVYHITEETEGEKAGELTAEKLETKTDEQEETVTAETDGFSLYTVEFTYQSLQYVLPGDSKIALSEILSAVGLVGEAEAVEVSNEKLFYAVREKESSEWVVIAKKAFHTTEWMKVTIAGIEYEITVTDAEEETEPARKGQYRIVIEPYGKDTVSYYDMIMTVFDADGNELDSYNLNEASTTDEWEPRVWMPYFEEEPARFELTCMHEYKYEGSIAEQLTLSEPFVEYCDKTPAIAVSEVNDPGQEVIIAMYSIECLEEDTPLHYIDAAGEDQVQEEWTRFLSMMGDPEGSDIGKEKWFAVRESTTEQSVTVRCDANLVLCDGCKLTVLNGLMIDPGASLTIWCQKETTGELEAWGNAASSSGPLDHESGSAGIEVPHRGSNNYATLTINGGNITARGRADGAAGIGGSYLISSGPITINGDHTVVKAFGARDAAGIGGGESAGNTAITINGGNVYAEAGKYCGSSIGSGKGSQNGPITINGGIVEAQHYGYSEGIEFNLENCRGAAIGSGAGAAQREGPNGEINITGGLVFANAGSGAGIGGGGPSYGNLVGGYDLDGHSANTINITGGSVVATSVTGAGIGGGGADLYGDGGNGGNILIENANVLAISYWKGAGIGGGNDGDGGKVTINSGSVSAISGPPDYRSLNDHIQFFWDNYQIPGDLSVVSKVSISLLENFALLASPFLYVYSLFSTSEWAGAGIGGGDDGDGGEVRINGGIVMAQAGKTSASAIGKGDGGSNDGSSIHIYEYCKTTFGDVSDGVPVIEDFKYGERDSVMVAWHRSYVLIEPGEVTVKFDVDGKCDPPEDQVLPGGSKATEPEDPVCDGFLFAGWYKDEQRTEPFDFNEPITKWETIVYGKWVEAFPLRVMKTWGENTQPEPVKLRYSMEYGTGKTKTGEVTIDGDNYWIEYVNVAEGSTITFSETPENGYEPESWSLRETDTTPGTLLQELEMQDDKSAVLDLSTLDPDILAKLKTRDSAQLVLNNKASWHFPVRKDWVGCVPQNYTITGDGGRTYNLSFNWDTVIDHVDVVLQHKNGSGVWEDVEYMTLQDAKDGRATLWMDTFNTTTDEDPANWRVREVIENVDGTNRQGQFVDDQGTPITGKQIMFDAADSDGPGQEASFIYSHEPRAGIGPFQTDFKVSYSQDEDGTFVITNRKGTKLSAEKKWNPDNRYTPKPEQITLVLQHREKVEEEGTTKWVWRSVETQRISEANGWKVRFDHSCGDDENPKTDWRIREFGQAGTMAYALADADRPEGRENTASFTIDGRSIVYTVKYEMDANGNTVITNSGREFKVEKKWKAVPGYMHPYSTFVVLQNLRSTEGGTERWESVMGAQQLRAQDNNWNATLIGWDEGDYRIREVEDPFLHPRVVLDKTDADSDGSDPVIFFGNASITGGAIDTHEDLYFNVKYVTDENGKTTITNESVEPPFKVKKVWDNDVRPDSVDVVLMEYFDNYSWNEPPGYGYKIVGRATLNEGNGWEAEFANSPDRNNTIKLRGDTYIIRELDKDGNVVLDPNDSEISHEKGDEFRIVDEDGADFPRSAETGKASHTVGSKTVEYTVAYAQEGDTTATITNTPPENTTAIPVEKKWELDKDSTLQPQSVKVVLQHKDTTNNTWSNEGSPAELNKANGWKTTFLPEDNDIENYRVRELDGSDDPKIIYASDDADKPQDAKDIVTFTMKDGEGDNAKDVNVDFKVTYTTDDNGKVTVTNKLNSRVLSIEKKWEIDLEKKDRPDGIEAVVQVKKNNKWETVRLVELKDDGDWKAKAYLSDGEYRVRELREETALETAVKEIREYITGEVSGGYDSVIAKIKEKAGNYYNMLPESIKNAAEESADKLKQELNATTENLYDKLLEQIGIASATNRIVYDKDDSDAGSSEKNSVIYSVDEYESVLAGGKEDAHKTKYKVSYSKDGDSYKITNKAIIEVDVIKRWFTFGVDEDDKPDSAWVVLMAKPKDGAMGNVENIAGAVGLDFSGILNYEFPVINPIEGGKNPISIISDLALGVDLGFLGDLLHVPKLAIAEVKADDDWTYKVTDSKYTKGIPMEYKGAELGSEVIRQIIKYISGIDVPVSYNPFENYFSIPTKAIKTFAGITDPSQLLDFSGLAGKILEKAKTLTMDDIQNFGPQTLLDDWHLMANVINVKIDFDTDDDNTISGTKIWKGDTEDKRPEWLKIHVKDGDKEIEGSPIELKKSDFKNKDKWTWKIEPDEDDDNEIDKDALIVTEEYPEGYVLKDYYVCSTDGLDITNTWTEKVPETVTVSGKKIWKDNDDQDGLRPEKIKVYLLADGERVKAVRNEGDETGDGTETGGGDGTGEPAEEYVFVETSKEGGWKYFFPDLPKYRTEDSTEGGQSGEGGQSDGSGQDPSTGNKVEIKYSVEEEPTDVITGVDGAGTYAFATTEDGYNLINTHTPQSVSFEGTKTWDDDDNRDGIRPESITIRLFAGEEEVDSVTVTEDDEWMWSFESQPKVRDGKEIEYTIKEDEIDKYETEVKEVSEEEPAADDTPSADDPAAEEPAAGGDTPQETEPEVRSFEVINTHTPETVTIEGSKTWAGDEEQTDARPDSITIRLLADDEEIETKEVTAEDEWKWTFEELPKFNAGKEIEYAISEDNVTDYTSEVEEYNVTNTFTPGETQVNVTKKWEDGDDQDGIRPDSVTVKLLADGEETEDTLTLSEDNGWKDSFTGLPAKVGGKEIEYTVEEETTDVITGEDGAGTYAFEITGDAGKGYTITNTHTPETVTVEGEKTWEDDDDRAGARPASITIRLLADNEEADSKEVTAEDEWKWTFEDLPKFNAGKEIEYAISEDNVTDYTSKVEEYNVTNTFTPGETQVNVTKKWEDGDDQDGIRPDSVTVNLLADGAAATDVEGQPVTAVLSEENDWKVSFTGLPLMGEEKEIAYTVEEGMTDVITGEDGAGTYAFEITGDADKGYTITNTHTPETVTIEGSKIWDDEDDQAGKRPESITIRMKAGGEEIDSVEVTADDEWKWSFADLPKFKDGKEIEYSISEDVVPDYTSEILGNAEAGFTVMNQYTPDKTQVTVTKIWKDEDNCDGIRPASVMVKLVADGASDMSEETPPTAVLSEDNDWTYTFRGLDAVIGGEEITYTVEEETTDVITGVDGAGTYAFALTGDAIKGYTITNTHTPELITVEGNKVWDDNDNQDGIRPESINVILKANGEEADSVEVTEEDDWQWSFADLPKYKAGAEITYAVEEETTDVITGEDAAGTYAIEITGDAAEGFTITNIHTPEIISVEGNKIWEDNDNQEGMRPDSITIRLLAENEEIDIKEVTENDDWVWRFEDLPKYLDGKEIAYSITEDNVTDYTSSVEGFDVTNTFTPGMTQVNVIKKWEDEDDQDGIRPDSVTVKLLADGEETGDTLTLSEENGWKDSFTGLPAKNGAKEIAYTVEEELTDVITGKDGEGTYGFELSGDVEKGLTITNIHTPGSDTPETITVEGNKIWEDDDDQAGMRPESITIRLLAENEEIDSKEVTEEDDWAWSFEDLPKYNDSEEEIEYSITEDNVTDYTSRVEGFDVINTFTPGMTQVNVIKKWEDEDDQDGIRPDSVTIRLLADGEETGDTLTLSEENGWKDSFTGLPEKDGEEEIAYTVEEELTDVITGEDGEETYASAITGDAAKGYTVTNTHTPEGGKEVTPPPVIPDDSTDKDKQYTITYVLNGGTYDGSTADIKEVYDGGTVISIHAAPTREGYTFLYWKGSEYQPGDSYKVTEDHTFTAQWKKKSKPSGNPPGGNKKVPPKKGTKTGDDTNTAPWVILLILAILAAGVSAAVLLKRRRTEQ